jgi:predicted unusual protein kinase regulating ubiquinone biosynthesis (AarF/ABC1/UbiB family)
MEYVNGLNICDIKDTDKNIYMDIVGHVMIYSQLIYGFFHCDAHSGNILFIKNNDIHQVCLIDFGICGMYNIKELNNYYDIFSNIGINNYHEVTKQFLTNFTNCPSNHEDYDLIFKEAKKLLYESFEIKKEFSFSEIYMLYSILKEYGIYTNESWIKTELAIASIDGCMKELKTNNIGLTDILKQKINKLNELENSELLN